MEAAMSTARVAQPDHLTVLVADADAAHRRTVRESLETHGLDIVGEAGDLASAAKVASRLRPDICLVDIDSPEDRPSEIGKIAKASPETLIVVLSQSRRPEDVVAALTHGASGYLLKGISGERLATTLRAARQGEPALARSLVPILVQEIRRGSARQLSLPSGTVTLTPREWEVGDLLRDGHSTGEIADRLGVSPITVRRHVGLLLQKLGAKDREEAVELFRAYGRR
jgi:DNA-binding NarL/FixJ family response regulator